MKKDATEGNIVAVCTSREKGVKKDRLEHGAMLEEGRGLLDDAHADPSTHRQVSLLAMEDVRLMKEYGIEAGPGDFAENLTTEGLEIALLPVGTFLQAGEAVLELTQTGKTCHAGCEIQKQSGKCIMPKRGVFARVVKCGPVRPGDTIRVIC